MSRKYWIAIPVGGVILAVALGLWVYQHHQHWDREHQSAYQASDLRFALDQCAQVAGLTDRVACQLEAIEADRQARQAAYAAKAQQHVATFTMGIMLASAIGLTLSGFGVILIYQTLNETRSLTRETRRIGEAQVRAYLSCTAGVAHIPTDEVSLSITLENHGHSPAYDVTAIGVVNAISGFSEFIFEEIDCIYLPPKETRDIDVEFGSIKAANKLKDNSEEFYVTIKIEWRDVFDRPHHVCARLMFPDSWEVAQSGLSMSEPRAVKIYNYLSRHDHMNQRVG
ncbi:MAG: hypothetical protein ACK4NO_05265 [Glycocaulis sp.]